MNRRSILAAYKKKSSHFQTGVTGFKSGNLFNTPALGAFQLDALAPDIAHRAVGDNHAGNLADGL